MALRFNKLKHFNSDAHLNSTEVDTLAIANFWQWFSNYANLIKTDFLGKGAVEVIHVIEKALAKVHPKLGFEFGNETGKQGNMEFFISAQGKPIYIPVVDAVIQGAPQIAGWDIIAYLQPRIVPISILVNGRELVADDILCRAVRNGRKVDCIFYISGLDRRYETDYLNTILLLLENIIGEYEMMTKVGSACVRERNSHTNAFPLANIVNLIARL